jgi:hypothetical protein
LSVFLGKVFVRRFNGEIWHCRDRLECEAQRFQKQAPDDRMIASGKQREKKKKQSATQCSVIIHIN